MASKLRNFFRISSSSDHPQPQTSPARPKSRFLRGRSTSSASQLEPNAIDVSPTANANPYFAHQGPPAIRHYNNDSAPATPPDQQENSKDDEAGKELARKLRRVASAPNAQGMFNGKEGEEVPEVPALPGGSNGNLSTGNLLVPGDPNVERLRNGSGGSFRRTYSSNSIKVRNVEVGPGSFDKIKLLGKGDVGKVYLVREKKSSRLYAMKGMKPIFFQI